MNWTSWIFKSHASWFVAAIAVCSLLTAAEPVISPAKRGEDGWLTHDVTCDYQAAATKIHVLLPAELKAEAKLPVLYMLPVEEGDGVRWGDPRKVVRELDLANRRNVICVYPTFSHLPWFCDHATDPKIRQETYFLKVVLPFVERTYPAIAECRGRYLLGFSKSGFGAWSLLLRNRTLFERAVAWDAPLMMEQPNNFGMGPIYGSAENFELYCLVKLLRQEAKGLQDTHPRLLHIGYGNFRDHHQQADKLLGELEIPRVYVPGPQRKHAWDSGWVNEAAELVLTGKHEANPQ